MTIDEFREFRKCKRDFTYFVERYCYIFDKKTKAWVPFKLWPYQRKGARELLRRQQIIIGKARQMGWTWLVLCYILWRMMFYPECRALISSARDSDAIYLLGEERMRGIFDRLPRWMTIELESPRKRGDERRSKKGADAKHHWALANGSNARAFPIGAGDSYVMTIVFIDEADSADEEAQLKHDAAVEPTIDGGGQLIKLSKFYKRQPPTTPFKVQYKLARAGKIDVYPIFAGALDHPDRTQEWFDKKCREAEEKGTEDDRKENYPLTEEEALEPRQEGKLLKAEFIQRCWEERRPKSEDELRGLKDLPEIEGLRIFVRPQPNRSYVIGADPAEGKVTSDDSALVVLDAQTLRQCAVLAGPIEIDIFGTYIDAVSKFYHKAPVLVERNNHGHAVLSWLRNSTFVDLLMGEDNNEGWLTIAKSKAYMYMIVAQNLRAGVTAIHDFETKTQLESIERGTLRAPEGLKDDIAVAYCLAVVGAHQAMTQPMF